VKNSESTLSLGLQTKMIECLSTEFTEKEQQWYIANLYIYINYHPTNEYPINLEDVFKMLGFANKGNAMKTIKNNFTKGEDYKIELFRTEKQVLNIKNGKNVGGSGLNKETVMMNVDTFKNLCMLVKTDEGKQIRKYYVKLENLYNKILMDELQEKHKEVESLEHQVNKVTKQLQQKTKQNWLHVTPGDAVYAVKSDKNNNESLISIGKSKNISERESNYLTHNQEQNMFYMRKCKNCNLTEKVLHHLLMSKRVSEREWFNMSEELAIYSIDLVCTFLDSFNDDIDKIFDTQILEELQKITKQQVVVETSNSNKTDVVITPQFPEFDYNAFIEQCCEQVDGVYCMPDEILGSYKIFARVNIDTIKKNKFYDYLKKHFPMEKLYVSEHNSVINCFKNIKPKTLNASVALQTKELQEFILDKCDVGYIYKVIEDDFLHSYSAWLDRTITSDELISIKAELNDCFYYGNINYSKIKKKYGYIGFKLKEHKPTIHCLRTKNLQKAVVKINIDTKKVDTEFSSINNTAFVLDKRYETIIKYIKNRTIIDNKFILDYKSNM
jgi:phage anti-repressor protein